jgi:hypothetical protein
MNQSEWSQTDRTVWTVSKSIIIQPSEIWCCRRADAQHSTFVTNPSHPDERSRRSGGRQLRNVGVTHVFLLARGGQQYTAEKGSNACSHTALNLAGHRTARLHRQRTHCLRPAQYEANQLIPHICESRFKLFLFSRSFLNFPHVVVTEQCNWHYRYWSRS